mmetsp:Transcript_18598/g.62784  ORF Transcript_18598/g.62784 Transcript_18598/m.62784 type:complete len:217 (+) Transcript_18598:1997-2647(+)
MRKRRVRLRATGSGVHAARRWLTKRRSRRCCVAGGRAATLRFCPIPRLSNPPRPNAIPDHLKRRGPLFGPDVVPARTGFGVGRNVLGCSADYRLRRLVPPSAVRRRYVYARRRRRLRLCVCKRCGLYGGAGQRHNDHNHRFTSGDMVQLCHYRRQRGPLGRRWSGGCGGSVRSAITFGPCLDGPTLRLLQRHFDFRKRRLIQLLRRELDGKPRRFG